MASAGRLGGGFDDQSIGRLAQAGSVAFATPVAESTRHHTVILDHVRTMQALLFHHQQADLTAA